MAEDKLIIYGYLTRADETKTPIYYVYEYEDDDCAVGIDGYPPIDVNEKFSTISDWRRRRDLQLTEKVRKPRG